MEPQTRGNEERLEERLHTEIKNHPLILPLEDHFSNFLREIVKGSHYPGGRGGVTIRVAPRCRPSALAAGLGAGLGVYWAI